MKYCTYKASLPNDSTIHFGTANHTSDELYMSVFLKDGNWVFGDLSSVIKSKLYTIARRIEY